MEDIDLRTMPIMVGNELVVMFHDGKRVCENHIALREDEAIGVSFEKGYVVVITQYETKFVCKGKAFISLWKN